MDRSTPLNPGSLHILLVLADADRHGYGILQAVRERSAGRVRLGTGSLYRHLAKLTEAGWVTEVQGGRTRQDARRGVSYRITADGHRALASERQRLRHLVRLLDGLRTAPRKGSL
jgi:DNA-binding PadR family transcriptional regulator